LLRVQGAEEHGGAEHEGEGQCPEHEDLFAGGVGQKKPVLDEARQKKSVLD
jgi:hypothetical protein